MISAVGIRTIEKKNNYIVYLHAETCGVSQYFLFPSQKMILALKTVNVLFLQKEKQDLEVLVKEMKDNCQTLTAESKEKSEEIAGCENMVSIFYKV